MERQREQIEKMLKGDKGRTKRKKSLINKLGV
jgi:hypothetical protein